MPRIALLSALITAAVFAAGCSNTQDEATERAAAAPATDVAVLNAPAALPTEPVPSSTDVPVSASVTLEAKSGSGAGGRIAFVADGDVVRLSGQLSGLQAGTEHGFHVHEGGDCSAPDASSAGGHFNPAAQPHGDSTSGGPYHLGDMPNVTADADGNATVDALLTGAELGTGSATDVVGKALVVHAQRDDYTSQPAGDAGARIACGVITQTM